MYVFHSLACFMTLVLCDLIFSIDECGLNSKANLAVPKKRRVSTSPNLVYSSSFSDPESPLKVAYSSGRARINRKRSTTGSSKLYLQKKKSTSLPNIYFQSETSDYEYEDSPVDENILENQRLFDSLDLKYGVPLPILANPTTEEDNFNSDASSEGCDQWSDDDDGFTVYLAQNKEFVGYQGGSGSGSGGDGKTSEFLAQILKHENGEICSSPDEKEEENDDILDMVEVTTSCSRSAKSCCNDLFDLQISQSPEDRVLDLYDHYYSVEFACGVSNDVPRNLNTLYDGDGLDYSSSSCSSSTKNHVPLTFSQVFVPPDGSCQFWSIAAALLGPERDILNGAGASKVGEESNMLHPQRKYSSIQQEIRNQIAEYVENGGKNGFISSEELSIMLMAMESETAEPISNQKDLANYIRSPDSYGTSLTLSLASRIYNVSFFIHSGNGVITIVEDYNHDDAGVIDKTPVIFLNFADDHYNLIEWQHYDVDKGLIHHYTMDRSRAMSLLKHDAVTRSKIISQLSHLHSSGRGRNEKSMFSSFDDSEGEDFIF